jgi:hypothetical protein
VRERLGRRRRKTTSRWTTWQLGHKRWRRCLLRGATRRLHSSACLFLVRSSLWGAPFNYLPPAVHQVHAAAAVHRAGLARAARALRRVGFGRGRRRLGQQGRRALLPRPLRPRAPRGCRRVRGVRGAVADGVRGGGGVRGVGTAVGGRRQRVRPSRLRGVLLPRPRCGASQGCGAFLSRGRTVLFREGG